MLVVVAFRGRCRWMSSRITKMMPANRASAAAPIPSSAVVPSPPLPLALLEVAVAVVAAGGPVTVVWAAVAPVVGMPLSVPLAGAAGTGASESAPSARAAASARRVPFVIALNIAATGP
jgi:hypothetical protein